MIQSDDPGPLVVAVSATTQHLPVTVRVVNHKEHRALALEHVLANEGSAFFHLRRLAIDALRRPTKPCS